MNRIDASVSPNRITLKPGYPATFEVTVLNQSDRFAAFQLEVLAPGYTTDPNRRWYRTEPKVSSKKPPGDRTLFRVAIVETPAPGFVGRLELMVRVFSLEFPDEARQPLQVDVEPGASYLILELPAPRLQAYPRNLIEIPFRIHNPRRQISDVAINLAGVDPAWMPNGTFQQVRIPAGQQQLLHFLCQPPEPLLAPCSEYPFTLEALPSDGLAVRAEGILELLPAGFVEFRCDRRQQQTPKKRKFWISWKSPSVTYPLELENTSNLWQDVELSIHGKDCKRCKIDIVPEQQILDPAESAQVDLIVHKKRPWLGLSQRLLLEADLHLKDTNYTNAQVVPRPKSQLLELRVFPIVPPWVQALILALLLLLLWWALQPAEKHLAPVTTVQISGDAGTVLSGSRDQTIRRWQVNGDRLESAGILAQTGKAVRVLRYRPVANNVVAAGLENGEIQFWDILTSKKLNTLLYSPGDRVFGLAFTQDSRTLYAGYGSGRVLEWNLEGSKTQPVKRKAIDIKYGVGFTVYAIALSERPGERLLVISGRYNQLALWDLQKDRVYRIAYEPPPGMNPFSQAIASQNNYIESITTAGSTMATADNQGLITLWNLAERKCSDKTKTCSVPILDQWQDGHQEKPVRSIAFTNNGCYLASAGDDGRVMLWLLTTAGQRIAEGDPSREIERINTRLNSVDAVILQGNLLIANDDYDNRIRFRRLNPQDFKNPFCQR
jgi:WD40 repeat protein